MLDFLISLSFLAIIIGCVYLIAIFGSSGSLIRGKVQHDEWTKFDENGIPVCGVGYRGYWTNTGTFGEDLPFKKCRKCENCSGWVSRETGEHAVVMSLEELLKKENIDVTE